MTVAVFSFGEAQRATVVDRRYRLKLSALHTTLLAAGFLIAGAQPRS